MYNVNKFKSLLTHYRVDDYCKLNFITNLKFSEFGFSFNSLYLLYVDFRFTKWRGSRGRSKVEVPCPMMRPSAKSHPVHHSGTRGRDSESCRQGNNDASTPNCSSCEREVKSTDKTCKCVSSNSHTRGRSLCLFSAWYWYGLLTITPWENATNINLICLFWTYQ